MVLVRAVTLHLDACRRILWACVPQPKGTVLPQWVCDQLQLSCDCKGAPGACHTL